MFNDDNTNRCIHCSVHECKYHSGDRNYCSLDSIRIASHEQHPTSERCVDCVSFECKGGASC